MFPQKNGQSTEFSTHTFCYGCDGSIVQGNSVVLECSCLNNHYCQLCARESIGTNSNTYDGGIKCPFCRNVTHLNKEAVIKAKKMEKTLISTFWLY